MKSLKECDLCENVMKLMCLAAAPGGTPIPGPDLMPSWLPAPALAAHTVSGALCEFPA